MSDQSLQRIEAMPPSPGVEPTTPQALMRRATDVAGICREIVLKTACEIQGRKFVRVEGWESIATAHGCFAGAENVERVYDSQGNHIGYKAQGVLRNAHGEVIATGEGYVGFDEKDRKGNPTWKNRAEYAGKAMAQTRAISRTCRGVFAHVVVLIDAGLSTTPAEEVPDGGFDDNERAARAKPVTPDPRQPSTAKGADRAKVPSARPAPPAPQLPEATEEQRQKWLSMLKPLGQAALDYAYEQGWLLPPAQDFPGEPLEAIALKDVPRGKRQASEILAEIQAKMDGDGDFGPQKAQEASASPSTSAPPAKDAQNRQPEAKAPPESDSGDSPQFDENGDEIETITGKLEAVSEKSGRSKKGPWTSYGLRIGPDCWVNTFSKTLGELAKKDKGSQVRVQYRAGERGNDLVSIERA